MHTSIVTEKKTITEEVSNTGERGASQPAGRQA
jgi:hypothetical protein